MSTELAPIVGNWYRHLAKGQLFCVIAIEAAVSERGRAGGEEEEQISPPEAVLRVFRR